jgi:GGDEF domain-containing protein
VKKILTELVSHDGLHDSLTGLISYPAFIESATREISSKIRSKERANLFLISLLTHGDEKSKQLAVNTRRELAEQSESEIQEIAARMLEGARLLREELRQGDLIARYTFADFLILNALGHIQASVVGIEMDFSIVQERNFSAAESLRSGIKSLEVTQLARFPG